LARQEVLLLAITRMLSGICTAGFIQEPDPVTGLKWVRPVKAFDTLLAEDMAGDDGTLSRCGDVVELDLRGPRPQPPHVEDRLAEFIRHRPHVVDRLEGADWAKFLAGHLDPAPEDVLCTGKRSLCLVQPEDVWANFSLDNYSGKFEARMGFRLAGEANHPRAVSQRGVSVTCLEWEARGRQWLSDHGGSLVLDREALLERLGAEAVYLTVGLSRAYRGEYWPLVVGVHAVAAEAGAGHAG